jgi:uncharacterized membrane protein YvbJ
MELYCKNCNNQVNDNDKFCPDCGAPVIFESQVYKSTVSCSKCNHENPGGAAFCEKCGASFSAAEPNKKEKSGPKNFSSTGTYSGKMIKGKTSKGWKVFKKIIIAFVLLGFVAVIIWFQVDPEAGRKLTDVLIGTVFMIVFFFFGWLFMRGKKRKTAGWDDDHYANVANDNDYDSDDDD